MKQTRNNGDKPEPVNLGEIRIANGLTPVDERAIALYDALYFAAEALINACDGKPYGVSQALFRARNATQAAYPADSFESAALHSVIGLVADSAAEQLEAGPPDQEIHGRSH
jgi:hypothetical protein